VSDDDAQWWIARKRFKTDAPSHAGAPESARIPKSGKDCATAAITGGKMPNEASARPVRQRRTPKIKAMLVQAAVVDYKVRAYTGLR
jgi:hypothetical protein